MIEYVFGAAAREGGELLSNEVKYFKLRRLNKLAEAFDEHVREHNIELEKARPMPQGIGTRILEQAALEDNDEVLELWAALIASGLDPARDSVKKAFVSILSEIDWLECRILKFSWIRYKSRDEDSFAVRHPEVDEYAKRWLVDISAADRSVAIQSLVRQRCLRPIITTWVRFDPNALSDKIERGLPCRDELRQLHYYLEELERGLDEVLGMKNAIYMQRRDEPTLFPELQFELTEFGIELMDRLEG